jgi:hypothetical protein
MPQHAILNAWGSLVMDALGEDARPYLVGSATTTNQWRDVDVRVMLDLDEWSRLLPGVPPTSAAGFCHPRWSALCMAFSAWGRAYTGLPIDFQIQFRDDANTRFQGRRDPLGIRISETSTSA